MGSGRVVLRVLAGKLEPLMFFREAIFVGLPRVFFSGEPVFQVEKARDNFSANALVGFGSGLIQFVRDIEGGAGDG